jgi:hypothetical protein
VRVEEGIGELRSVGRARIFETSRVLPHPRLFALDALGEIDWLKALRLEGYAPRRPQKPRGLQQGLAAGALPLRGGALAASARARVA